MNQKTDENEEKNTNEKGIDNKELTQWLAKVKDVGKGEADLSRDEDLAIAIMNLVSLEEHFYFTAMKTNNQKYLEILKDVRGMRQKLLKKIVVSPEGEEWCISKHLLAVSMRLIEVGNKEYDKDKKEANAFYQAAFESFSLFFAINLKMIIGEKLAPPTETAKAGVMHKFSDIIKKIVDCCKEW